MKRIIQISVFVLIIIFAALNFLSSPLALILGFIFTLILGHPFPIQSKKAIGLLLKASVIGLGFGMSVTETIKTSKDGFIITALSIFLTISLGLLLIKLLKIDKKLGFLMTSGTAICGGSAIAAISPVIKANSKTISVAIGVVFLLNSIALLIFPTLGHLFDLSQTQFGTWCAIAIHDTSSVVGAALQYGDEALQIATTVKLARTLWIIPLSFFAMALFKSKDQNIKIPYFILGFIAAMFINSYHLIPEIMSVSIV
ncbi:MAG: putative sulfate exporter family transporter, partial [Xanthomarina sp.]